jgi:hypothetical protein
MLFSELGIPAAPTLGGVALGFIVVAYKLLSDRRAVMSEIGTLRSQVKTLDGKVTEVERLYDEERGLKHKAFNDVARTVMALDLVQRLARECTCNVLSPLSEIIDRLLNELETVPHVADHIHRRRGDD